jgi:hypothetical protein
MGSNQSESASFALAIASSSVSPAEAQPGNSGKTADQRFVLSSKFTNKRKFTRASYAPINPPTSPASSLATFVRWVQNTVERPHLVAQASSLLYRRLLVGRLWQQ